MDTPVNNNRQCQRLPLLIRLRDLQSIPKTREKTQLSLLVLTLWVTLKGQENLEVRLKKVVTSIWCNNQVLRVIMKDRPLWPKQAPTIPRTNIHLWTNTITLNSLRLNNQLNANMTTRIVLVAVSLFRRHMKPRLNPMLQCRLRWISKLVKKDLSLRNIPIPLEIPYQTLKCQKSCIRIEWKLQMNN